MKHNRNYLMILLAVASLFLFDACQQPGGNSTGSEYMPDMGHSIAYEANVYNYYYQNTWDSASVIKLKELSQPRKPVAGTIPRGYAGGVSANAMAHIQGTASTQAIRIPANGSVPYYYADTEEERTRAMNEIVNNPFPISESGLAQGKELYTIYCGVCHGEKGDGGGYLVRDDGGVYPAQPAILTSDEFTAASNGRFYHAIMYGKNVMGSHADKLSYEERWQVIHYIRSLQAKNKKLDYSATANTLNAVDVPASNWKQVANNYGGGDAVIEGGEMHGAGHDGESHHHHDHDAEDHHEDGHDHKGHDHDGHDHGGHDHHDGEHEHQESDGHGEDK